jgi:hypothetical protein
MSKALDYSKWDKLELSDNDEDSVYRSMPSAVSNQFPSSSSSSSSQDDTYGQAKFTNDAQYGGCKHVITPAGTTTRDLDIVQSVFDELKKSYNLTTKTLKKNIGEIKPENCLKHVHGSLSVAYISYQKQILGNALREKHLEQYLLSQAASRALEEWNAKKASGKKVHFDDAWPFIHTLHSVDHFQHFLPRGNLSAKLERMTDDSNGTISAGTEISPNFLRKLLKNILAPKETSEMRVRCE